MQSAPSTSRYAGFYVGKHSAEELAARKFPASWPVAQWAAQSQCKVPYRESEKAVRLGEMTRPERGVFDFTDLQLS